MAQLDSKRPQDYDFLFTPVCENVYIFANFLTEKRPMGCD